MFITLEFKLKINAKWSQQVNKLVFASIHSDIKLHYYLVNILQKYTAFKKIIMTFLDITKSNYPWGLRYKIYVVYQKNLLS